MLIPTHLLIADMVHAMLEQKLQTPIPKLAYCFGNIKPDIDPKLAKMPHFLTVIDPFIDVEMQTLSHASHLSYKEFAYRFGVLSHYVADVFCSAHNPAHFDEAMTLKHFVYEYQLHKALKKRMAHLIPTILKRSERLSTSELDAYLHDTHQGYLRSAMSIESDLEHAISVLLSIGQCLLACYLMQPHPVHPWDIIPAKGIY